MLKWIPKFGPDAKIEFRESAGTKEQANESETKAAQWGL
jgi:hypothetical protein